MKQKICLTLIFTFILTLISQDILFARIFQSPKYTLAVIPFSIKGRISGDYSALLAERLQQELIRTNMFSVRDLTSTQNTLRNNGIIPSNCSSIECGQQAGRALGVRLIANGEVSRVGSRIILDIRIMHVASGNVVQSVREQFYDGSIDAVLNDMSAVSAKLVGNRAQAGRQASQQPANIPPQQSREGITTTQQPHDVFTIGEGSEVTDMQPLQQKRSDNMKWVLVGLLVAGGIGAGVLIASGNGNSDSGDNNGSGVVTKLPGHPKFP